MPTRIVVFWFRVGPTKRCFGQRETAVWLGVPTGRRGAVVVIGSLYPNLTVVESFDLGMHGWDIEKTQDRF